MLIFYLVSSFNVYNFMLYVHIYSRTLVNYLVKFCLEIQNSTFYKGVCPEGKSSNVSKPCYAPFSLYGPCQPDSTNISKSMFGLNDKKPCIFLKVNKVRNLTIFTMIFSPKPR